MASSFRATAGFFSSRCRRMERGDRGSMLIFVLRRAKDDTGAGRSVARAWPGRSTLTCRHYAS